MEKRPTRMSRSFFFPRTRVKRLYAQTRSGTFVHYHNNQENEQKKYFTAD